MGAAVHALDDLLGDGRRPAPPPPGPERGHEGARHGPGVDAAVLVEAGVLGGEEGGDEVGGDVREIDPAAINAVHARLAQDGAVPVGDGEGVVGPHEARGINPQGGGREAEGEDGQAEERGEHRGHAEEQAARPGRLHGSTVRVVEALRATKRGA